MAVNPRTERMKNNPATQKAKKVRTLGGTGKAEDTFDKAMRRTSSMGESAARRTPGVAKPKAMVAKKTTLTKTPLAKPKAKPTTKPKLGEKPPAGSDAYAKRKYGKNAWNNGYTN